MAHPCPALLLLAAVCGWRCGGVAAQDDEQAGGRLWPETPAVDAEEAAARAETVCDRAFVVDYASRDTLPESSEMEVGPLSSYVLAMRTNAGITPESITHLAKSCRRDDETTAEEDAICDEAIDSYSSDLLMPLAAPIFLGFCCILMHCACCFVACCRSCRRSICCHERVEPYNASKPKVVGAVLLWACCSAGIQGLGISIHELSLTLHSEINSHMCAGIRLASDTIGGSEEDAFLGTEKAASHMNELAAALDVDGSTMATIGDVMQETEEFTELFEAFWTRSHHFYDVVRLSGPGFRAYEHRCVFCSVALGDPDNPVYGFPPEGVIPAFLDELRYSPSAAMYQIREYTRSRLTGENLTELSALVKRARGALDILNYSATTTLLYSWPKQMPSVDAAESLRVAVFLVFGIACMGGAAIGWAAFCLMKINLKRRPDDIPLRKPHLCAWCCGFCYVAAALIIGGFMLLASVVGAETCIFLEDELLPYTGWAVHADVVRLVPMEGGGSAPGDATRQVQANLAIDLARSCFVDNGTGDLLEVLELTEPLLFEPELSSGFFDLQSKAGEPVNGLEAENLLKDLAALAADYGDLFVLDPLPLPVGTSSNLSNGSLGVLELSANVEALLLDSALDAEDRTGPDQITTHRGLNTYAALIAGPGKYTFLHGTAGGGFVITPERPTESEIASLPETVANALLYGRAKEILLADTAPLRCDTLDDGGATTVRYCTAKEFAVYLEHEIALIQQAADASAAEAERVYDLFLEDLQDALLPMLQTVHDLRLLLGCGFLYDRMLAAKYTMCGKLVGTIDRGATQIFVLALASAVGVFVQYKVWRHHKDNKVVGEELSRFGDALRKFEDRMSKFQASSQFQGKRWDYLRRNEESKVIADDNMAVEIESAEKATTA